MTPRSPDIPEDRADDAGHAAAESDADLWFLPGPIREEPDDFAPGPRAGPGESTILADWAQAEAGLAARLARVAGRLGALDDRLRRGPGGWRHRLALIEAAELSWFAGDRISPDRLALWISLRLSGVQQDAGALARIGWAVRRLTSGPCPATGATTGQGPEISLADFLGRQDPMNAETGADLLEFRAASWLDLMATARDLHPISRACMGFHLWSLAGLGQNGDRMEAAVTAGRIAASEGKGAVFAPLAMGGARGLRSGGPPAERLARWLKGMDSAIITAMRHLDDIETWAAQAETVMAPLSGRTPPALRSVLAEWPLVSAPMAERLCGASRAAVQRNLGWMQARGLVREVTGHGRFRMWRAAIRGAS